jgi:GNAT superfamily N-acetyltransferase
MANKDDAGPAEAVRPGTLRVVSAARLGTGQRSALQHVYEESFPPHLRVPLADLATASARDRMMVALDNDNPVGFAALRLLGAAGWVFLRYFGVAADHRRQGMGQRFWRLLQPELAASGWPARIAFEVEDPQEACDDPTESAIRRNRISFWERCGAQILPVAGYVMPALTDIGAPEPMVLMAAIPERGNALPDRGDALTATELSALVAAIYQLHYGLTTDDPLVRIALATLPPGS